MSDALRSADPARLGGYRLVGRLGSGGQGVVYLGETQAGVRVAVKLLRSELAEDTAARTRFVREVAASRRVQPFCTARVLDADVTGDQPYVVSEYIEGPSLQQLVTRDGPRYGDVLHRLAIGIVTALASIHQSGVIHRDLKPANVLLGPDGPRVIDFGIAKALDATATLTGTVLGTPSYMAPEQFTPDLNGPDGRAGRVGRRLGPAADVFAWASTMVFAATGRPPFGNDLVPAVMHRVLYEPPDLRGLERIDARIRTAIVACLAKDPALRPTAADVLWQLMGSQGSGPSPDVAGVLSQGAALANAAPLALRAPTPLWRRATVRRRLAAGVGAAAIAVGSVLLWSLIRPDPGPGQTDLRSSPSNPSGPSGPSVPSSHSQRPSPSPTPERPPNGYELTGTHAFVFDWLDGPVTLAAYRAGDVIEVWNPTSQRFETDPPYDLTRSMTFSPDGTWLAGMPAPQVDDVQLIQRSGGEGWWSVRPPGGSKGQTWLGEARWSPDGSQVLLTVGDRKGKSAASMTGFLIVDTPHPGIKQLTTRFVKLTGLTNLAWTPDGKHIAANPVSTASSAGLPAVQIYDLNGKQTSQIPNAGWLLTDAAGPYTPDGRKLATLCTEQSSWDERVCVWDAKTGARLTTVQLPYDREPKGRLRGWYDNKRLLTTDQAWTSEDVVAVDLDGNVSQHLIYESGGVQLMFARSPY